MATSPPPPEPPPGWLKLRKRTVILFTIESLLVGMDYSLTFLTLWIYIKTLVKPETPTVYYSIISAAFLTASLAISGIVGRFVDKSRNVRKTFFIMNTIVIIGNLIYVVPSSPWTLVIGRLMSGFGGPLRSVITGELARCYHPTDLSKVLSVMGMSYSFGFIAGPCFNFAFKNVDFRIGHWPVTFANMPGIYMAVMFSFVQVISVFLISDISKIYDLKGELTKYELSMLSPSLHTKKHTKKEKVVNCEKNQKEGQRDDFLPRKDTNQSNDNLGFDNPIINIINEGAFQHAESHPLIASPHLSDKQIEAISCEHQANNNKTSNANKMSTISYGCFETGTEVSNTSFTYVEGKLISSHQSEGNENQPLLTSQESSPSTSVTLRKLFTNIDTTLLLCLAFFESYFAVSFDMWVPMLVIDTMGWSIELLNWIIIGIGVACTVPCLILAFVDISDKQMYIAAMGCILSLSIMETIFIVLSEYNSNQVFDIFAWTVFSLMYAFLVVMEEVFLVGCLAKMVNSNIQTFSDSVRLTMYRLGALIALLTSALIFQWIEIVGCVHITIIVAGFTLMVVRRESFMNPKIIV